MTKNTALKTMFTLLGVVLIFHLLVITQQISYDKVWAGKLKSVDEMIRFETFSIGINIIMTIVLHIKYNLLQKEKTNKTIDVVIWIFTGFFALNTLGNLFAKNIIELILGTFLTLIATYLCFIIARKEKK